MNNPSLMVNQEYPQWLDEFIAVYQRLSTDNLALIHSIYDPNITFVDPIHQIEGIDDLLSYFEGLYKNLSSCQFVINEVIAQQNQAALYWEMSYQHSKLNNGKTVIVHGSSKLIAKNGKVIFHRDYLDLGAMLYEHIPVIGKFIQWIKVKAAK